MIDHVNPTPASPLPAEEMRSHIHRAYTTIAENMRIAFRYSIYLTLSFVGIFIIARLTGYSRYTEFRFVNYILLFPIGFAAIRRAYILNGDYLEYFNGLGIAFLLVVMAQLWYAILFTIYLYFDTAFLNFLVSQMPAPVYYPRSSIFFVFMVEGLGAAAIVSLTLMQYFKWKGGRWGFRR